jgi:hypothetical protein
MARRNYVGWWLHTLDENGDIEYQGQLIAVRKIDYEMQLYSWMFGEESDKTSIARSAVEDPKLCRLYRSNSEMNAAYKKQLAAKGDPYAYRRGLLKTAMETE